MARNKNFSDVANELFELNENKEVETKHNDKHNDVNNDNDKHNDNYVNITIEKRKKKNANLQILINDELKERFKKTAEKQGVSMGQIVVTLIERYLDSVENK